MRCGTECAVIYVCKYLQIQHRGQLTAVSDEDAVQMVVNPLASGHLGSEADLCCV